MIIYIDLIMIFDFIYTFLMMYVIEKIYINKINIKKLLLVSFISSILILLSIYIHYIYIIYKLLGGVILVLFTDFKSLKEFISKTSSFYFINYSLYGLKETFKIESLFILFLLLIIILIIYMIDYFKKINILSNNFKYNVLIKVNDKYHKFIGFLDTGNNANYQGIPICFINSKYKKLFNNQTKIITIVKTINNLSYIEIFETNLLIIINNRKYIKKVYLSLSDINEDIILNRLIIMEGL